MRRELDVMRVLRVPPLGKLVIEVGTARYESLAEITDEKTKRVLLAAIGELINFAGNYEALVEAGVAPPSESSKTASQEPPLEQRQAEFLARLESERDALKGTPPLNPTLAAPSPTVVAEIPSVQRELSVAEQIDAILQQFIAADPEMANRSVHLIPNPSGGILIEVDGTMYQKPGDIPEQPIQLLIKRAVKKWDSA